MKQGDIIQIEGRLGFEMNPKKEVMEIDEGLVTLRSHPFKTGGLLEFQMTTKHGIEMLEGKYKIIEI